MSIGKCLSKLEAHEQSINILQMYLLSIGVGESHYN